MIMPLLEVIVLDATDARNARDGGADRVELVSDMAAAGLSPSPATVEAVLAAVDVPVRVMLRQAAGFAARDVDVLLRTAKDLRAAGAREFVLGFLDGSGHVDLPAMTAVLAVLDGAPWTFHRAVDHATSRPAAWRDISGLPGLDAVLTAGAPGGLTGGLPVVLDDAPVHAHRILAGGGLRREHLGPLRAAGVTAFHTGSAVRRDWTSPVDAVLVARLREALQSL